VNEVGPGLVKPVLVITEGARVVVGQVTITGNTVPKEKLPQQINLSPGDIYYGPNVVNNRDLLTAFYLDEGYTSVEVTATQTPVTTSEGTRADVTFKIVEGPQTIIEHIFITGNVRTKREVIAEQLQIAEGRPLGQAALTESRRRLTGLGLFRRIQFSVISHGDPSLRDVVIAVEEARQSTIGYGGGLQVDQVLRSQDNGDTTSERYEVAPRGFFEIGRRNLGGRNRSLNLYSRLSLRPNPDDNSNNPFGFSEYRVVGTYRAPGAVRFGDLTATAAIEQGVRTGFNFSRKGVNAELSRRLNQTTRGSARYAFATTRIFDYQLIAEDDPLAVLTVDRVFPQVRLSALSGTLSRDTRSDPIDPKQGLFLSSDSTLAIRAIGSEVGFGKTFMQGFVYHSIGKRGVVVAGGARLGLARALVRTVETIDVNGTPVSIQVRDLPASERFFVGGDTTIRGYAIDSVGVPETITSAGFPKGGDAEVVLNAELRTPLFGKIGAVFFVDGGNVFARAADLDLTRLRGSVGLGGRYATPIGPIRMDIGFKLDRRTIGTRLEPRYAIHFSIGQAF
jgi:outer membrane protein insertion porin family